ncbi:MAG: tetraacyldisaccharide 4'-kinase, partial [Pyrinomonadaceae bacterium]
RPVFAARTRVVGVKPVAQSVKDESTRDAAVEVVDGALSGASPGAQTPRAVAAFCGVGNPRAFFENLRRDGCEIRFARAFADHHDYRQSEVDGLAREAGRAGADVLLTTEKDAVKLRGLRFDVPCYAVEIELEIDDAAGLFGLVRAALAAGDERGARGGNC